MLCNFAEELFTAKEFGKDKWIDICDLVIWPKEVGIYSTYNDGDAIDLHKSYAFFNVGFDDFWEKYGTMES